MKRKGLWILGAVVALLLLFVILLPLLFNANRYRPEIESRLSKSLARTVKIGDLKLALFSGGITASNITISDDPAFSRQPFVQAKALKVGVELIPLLFHQQVLVESLVLEEPTVRLLQSSAGKWNVSTIGQKQQGSAESSSDISIAKLEINDGRIEVGQANGKTQAYTDVSAKATDMSYAKAFPFSFAMNAPQGGKIKLDGKAGPLNRSDMSRTPLAADVTVDNLDLAATGFVSPESDLAGILDYKGKLTSDGRILNSQGKANAAKLRLVKAGASASQPIDVDYHSQYDLGRDEGSINQTAIHVGKSTASLAGTYSSKSATTVLDLKLLGNKMSTQDVQGLLPALGVVLPSGASLQGGTVSTNLALRGPSDRLVTTGTLNIDNARVAGFSMGKGLSSVAALAGLRSGSDTSIQVLSSNLRIAPEGMRFDNLNMVVPELGSMTGSGTIGADSSLNFHLVAKLNTSGNALGLVTTALGARGGGAKSIPIQVTGTTAKPVFIPDMGSAVAGQLLPSAGAGQQNANPLGGLMGGLLGGNKKKK
jgi:AsmA protein